jgi:integrase
VTKHSPISRKQWKVLCAPNIGEAIDAPRLYTLAGLPAGPSWTQVRQLIAGIGQEQPGDIRNRAIITLLAVYGFRSSEVCRLTLDDLDWERELIHLSRTKQPREHQYPLVREVGEAILLYLRKARPQTDRREVFPSSSSLSLPPFRAYVLNFLFQSRVQFKHQFQNCTGLGARFKGTRRCGAQVVIDSEKTSRDLA